METFDQTIGESVLIWMAINEITVSPNKNGLKTKHNLKRKQSVFRSGAHWPAVDGHRRRRAQQVITGAASLG